MLTFEGSIWDGTKEPLKETVYRALRAYQDGEIKPAGMLVGMLDQKLTAVYDRISTAIDQERKSR